EASGYASNYGVGEAVLTRSDLVGQIRSAVYIPGISPSPEWTGNITATYMLGDFSASLNARYIGGAKMDKTWGDSPDDENYMDENGVFLNGSVDNNYVKQYMNFALNANYNLQIANLKQFQ